MDHSPQGPRVGPVGGHGGKPFENYAIPDGARLTAIYVYSNWVVDALQFDYVLADGTPGSRTPIGGLGGRKQAFYLDEDETLTGISGRCGWYVDAIRFHTNKRASALFGGRGGERDFALQAPPGYEVGGFFGRCDWYIDALGLTLRPLAEREGRAGDGMTASADATPAEAEETLDETIDAVAAELAAEAAAYRDIDAASRGDAVAEMAGDAEAMLGETATREDVAALEAATLREIATAVEPEDDEALDMALVALIAEIDSSDELAMLEAQAALQAIADLEEMEPGDEETVELSLASRVDIDPLTGQGVGVVTALASEVDDAEYTDDADDGDDTDDAGFWQPLDNDGVPIDARVIVRREVVAGEEAVDALEERAMAEAIAALKAAHSEEGTVDVTVYTQVIDESGDVIATVMAVATEAGAVPGDERGESAVMVTDAIESEDDLALLEEEAAAAALNALEEDLGRVLDDADVMLYSGLTTDEASGQTYGAVVAVASPIAGASPMTGEEAVESAALAADAPARFPGVVQFGGQEPRPQDLQLVEGIGPKIAELLVEHGIYDLGVLAETPVERLRDILGAGGRRFRLADPGTWPRQATLAAAGDWAALTELQTQLKAGR